MFLVIIYIRLFIIPMFNSFFLIPFNMGFKLNIFYNFFFFNQNLYSILFYLQIVYGVGFYNRYLCRLEKVANIYGVKKMSKHLWFIGQWKRAMFNAFVANYLRNLCVAFLSIQTLFTRTANFSSTQLNRIRKTNRTSFFGCCWRLCRDFFFQGGGRNIWLFILCRFIWIAYAPAKSSNDHCASRQIVIIERMKHETEKKYTSYATAAWSLQTLPFIY